MKKMWTPTMKGKMGVQIPLYQSVKYHAGDSFAYRLGENRAMISP